MNYSVLMSVYKKEKAEYLRDAMNSMWNQSVCTNDFVLVCDGPLTDELNEVISDMKESHGDVLKVCRLRENKGLGIALNAGIRKCKNELVARMDSDDISRIDRCERQLEIFKDNPYLDIVSGTVEEFIDTTDNILTCRVLPMYDEEIKQFSRKRNPFNHPCIMYKKSAVERAGGYKKWYLLEDYYLWVRMLISGANAYNIPEPLLWMRVGSDLYKRRGGMKYGVSQCKLFKYMYERKYISFSEFIKASTIRMISANIPNGVRALAYKFYLRKGK